MYFEKLNLLWFLFLVLIPLLIHLFRFRRFRKVLFTRIDLLKQITVKTGFGNRLRKIVLMTLRMLAIAALVFAFARPFLKNTQDVETQSFNKLVLFLDNSLSMTGTGEEGFLFEAAKNRARALVNNSPTNYGFQILSHSGSTDAEELLDKEDVLKEIDRLSISNRSEPLDAIYNQLNILANANSQVVFVSDFRKGFLQELSILPKAETQQFWLPVPAFHSENIAIDSAWFQTPAVMPEQNTEIFFKLTNYGTENISDVSVQLSENNTIRGVVNVSVDAGKSVIASIPFNSGQQGWKEFEIRVPGDAFNFDDVLYLSFPVQKSQKGLILSDTKKSPYLQSILTQAAGFEMELASPLELRFDKLNQIDLLIIDGVSELSSGLVPEIRNFVVNGGNLLVFPNATGNLSGINAMLANLQLSIYNQLLSSQVNASLWDTKNPLLQGIFSKKPSDVELPTIFKYYALNNAARQQNIWKIKNDMPLFAQIKRGAGTVFMSSVALDQSFGNLAMNPLFVPFTLRLASFKEMDFKLFYNLGSHEFVPLQNRSALATESLIFGNENMSMIPEIVLRDKRHFLALHGETEQAGFYKLSSSDETLLKISINYPRTESVMELESVKNLEEFCTTNGIQWVSGKPDFIAQSMMQQSLGQPLWKYFVMIALLFLLIEMILIRVWKM